MLERLVSGEITKPCKYIYIYVYIYVHVPLFEQGTRKKYSGSHLRLEAQLVELQVGLFPLRLAALEAHLQTLQVPRTRQGLLANSFSLFLFSGVCSKESFDHKGPGPGILPWN